MNNHKLNKAIHEIKSISMTKKEKAALLQSIFAKVGAGAVADVGSAKVAGKKPVHSPYFVYDLRVWMGSHRVIGTVMAAVLIVLISGGSVTLAAEGSLPGDALYGVKVAVTEPIRTALKTTPEDKAAWQAHLASERMQEAETLAVEGKLDAPKKKEIETLLARHTAAFEEAARESEPAVVATAATVPVATLAIAEAPAPAVPAMMSVRLAKVQEDHKPRSFSAVATSTTAATTTDRNISKIDRIKSELRNNLRRSARNLEEINKKHASSTDTQDIKDIVESARIKADAIDGGGNDSGDNNDQRDQQSHSWNRGHSGSQD